MHAGDLAQMFIGEHFVLRSCYAAVLQLRCGRHFLLFFVFDVQHRKVGHYVFCVLGAAFGRHLAYYLEGSILT